MLHQVGKAEARNQDSARFFTGIGGQDAVYVLEKDEEFSFEPNRDVGRNGV
jgi:hypothetical protein